jgi:hypothetical protein
MSSLQEYCSPQMLAPQLARYLLLYGAYLLLNLVIVPRIARRRAAMISSFAAIIVLTLLGIGLGAAESRMLHQLPQHLISKAGEDFAPYRNGLIYAARAGVLFGLYAAFRHWLIRVMEHPDRHRRLYGWLRPVGALLLIVWALFLFFFLALSTEVHLIAAWAIITPPAVALCRMIMFGSAARSRSNRCIPPLKGGQWFAAHSSGETAGYAGRYNQVHPGRATAGPI